MIVLDTSVLYALLDAADGRHHEAVRWYEALSEELVTTPMVLAETDHLAATQGGPQAVRALRQDVRAGAYIVDWWSTAAREAADLADRYEEIGLGLTDASLVALAARVGTSAIATFDERHFRVVLPLRGAEAFHLIPIDLATRGDSTSHRRR